MPRRPARNQATAFFAALWLIFPALLSADTGADIYQRGITESGRALIGDRATPAPSTLFPCSNCHGERAAGSKESGITAPDITWGQLIQPYRKDLDGGRPRQAYDAGLFRRLLTDGMDSDGQSLTASMPRYVLSDSEINALIGYLQTIRTQNERGVTDDAIHFWLRLPYDPSLANAMSATVNAYISNLNQQGGIYRRQIQLHDFSAERAADSAFAIIDLRMLERQQSPSDHISLGIFESRDAGDNAYFLYPHPANSESMLQNLTVQTGWTILDADQNGMDELLHEDPANDIYTVLIHRHKSMPIEQLLNDLDQRQRYPGVLTDTVSLSTEQRAAIDDHPAPVYLLTPPGRESVLSAGRRQYVQLARKTGLSGEYLQPRLWALTLMELLVATLEQSGKQLTEQQFIITLQSHVDLRTDFGPPLSYSATRRVGNDDAVVIQLN